MDDDISELKEVLKEFALMLKVNLHFISKERLDEMSYYNRCSSSSGSTNSNPEIIIGFYENKDEMLISFFHEYSHLIYNATENSLKRNYSNYEIEKYCWEKAFIFLKKFNLEETEVMHKYAKEMLKTYEDNTDNHIRYAKFISLPICMTEEDKKCPYCNSEKIIIFESYKIEGILKRQSYCKDCHKLFFVIKED